MLELLQDISSRLIDLEDKIEAVTDQVEDLVDDYHVNNNIKYLDNFVLKSIKAKFEALRIEF